MPADIILNQNDTEIVENVRLTRSAGRAATILLESEHGNIHLGGDGRDGDLILRDNQAKSRIHLDSHHGLPVSNEVRIFLNGRDGNIQLGGDGVDGDLVLKDHQSKARVHVDSQHGSPASENIRIFLNGRDGNIVLGGDGVDGDLVLLDDQGKSRVHVDAQHGSPNSRHVRFFANGRDGHLTLGGNEKVGELRILDGADTAGATINGAGRVTCRDLEATRIDLDSVGDLATRLAQLSGGSPSDQRLKDDIRLLEDAPRVIDRLSAIRFRWKPDSGIDRAGEQIGLLAQQVQEVLPEAVQEDSEGYLRIDYDAIVALCLESVKTLRRELSQQGTRISLLEDRLSQIEGKS